MLRGVTLWTTAWMVACLAVAAQAGDDRTESERIGAVLGEVRTRTEIDSFVGLEAQRCVAGKPGFELCEWNMGNRQPGWKPLARAIDTRARIALVCELPADGSPREDLSCGAYPMASDRDRWKVRPTENGRRRKSADVSREKQAKQRRAVELLDSARTLAALSGLVGAIPDECTQGADGQRSCLWRTTARTWGHGTLATTIEAPYRKKVRMRCTLPGDGGRRAPDSCHVEIGA